MWGPEAAMRMKLVRGCLSLLSGRKDINAFSLQYLPVFLKRVRNALIENGVFFVSVQLGQGERVLPDGQFFSYYAREDFQHII
jgi:hypothetical protein